MTRKFAYPGVVVPGATMVYGDEGLPEYDKKRRRVWHLPAPSGAAEHNFVATEKMTDEETGEVYHVKSARPVFVNIYRGMDARLANWYRGQARRAARKAAARRKEQKEKEDAT